MRHSPIIQQKQYFFHTKYLLDFLSPSTIKISSLTISFNILLIVESANPNNSRASLFVMEPFSSTYFLIVSFRSSFIGLLSAFIGFLSAFFHFPLFRPIKANYESFLLFLKFISNACRFTSLCNTLQSCTKTFNIF